MVSSPSFAAHQRPDTLADDHSMLRFPRLGAESPFQRNHSTQQCNELAIMQSVRQAMLTAITSSHIGSLVLGLSKLQ
jgi:hypothetical protein